MEAAYAATRAMHDLTHRPKVDSRSSSRGIRTRASQDTFIAMRSILTSIVAWLRSGGFVNDQSPLGRWQDGPTFNNDIILRLVTTAPHFHGLVDRFDAG